MRRRSGSSRRLTAQAIGIVRFDRLMLGSLPSVSLPPIFTAIDVTVILDRPGGQST
jgi:hypothetical protein